MSIGTLGPVVFETSSKKIRTFQDLQRSGSARWEDHEIIGQKPKAEFLGPGKEQITFTIKIDAALGVNPTNELYMLRFIRDNGYAVPFILDGKPVSLVSFSNLTNLWVIESLTETWKNVTNKGVLLAVDVQVTLFEYIPPPKK